MNKEFTKKLVKYVVAKFKMPTPKDARLPMLKGGKSSAKRTKR